MQFGTLQLNFQRYFENLEATPNTVVGCSEPTYPARVYPDFAFKFAGYPWGISALWSVYLKIKIKRIKTILIIDHK